VKTRTCCDGILETHRDIIKRPNDRRSIECYTLTNGLKLLLISDPSTATAAACLNVIMENANPIHPFTIFDGGNLELFKISNSTLKEEQILKFFKFYEKYYSSNIMSVSVVSKEPIDKLKEMVIPLLNKIKNRNISAPKWSESPFKPQQLKKKIEIISIEDKHQLLLLFPLSDTSKLNFKSKPWMYITQLLNQTGDGSLSKYLKKKNMCTVINPDFVIRSEFGFKEIELKLTEKGIDRVNEVIEAIFQYINMIKDSEIQRKIFDNIQNLMRNNFLFAEKADASDEVIHISRLMQFNAYGYSDKLSQFVLRIIKEISNFEFDEQSFNNIKRGYFKNLNNLKSKDALSIASTYTKAILGSINWIDDEQIAVEEKLSFNRFQIVMQNIFSKVFIESFAYGNYESKEVIKLADKLAKKLKCRFLMLPSHHYARSTISASVKLQMLVQLMSPRFYNVLVLTNQLVFAHTVLRKDEGYNVGILFYIESSNSTEYIDHRIEEFIKFFKAELEAMKSEEFEDIQKKVLTAYKKTPENLRSSADRFSKEFREGTYIFNRPDLSVSEAEKITKQDLLQILDDYMICGAKYRAKLSVRVGDAQQKAKSVPAIKFCSES
ncbi:insulin-degrading enzyme-like protein, partial [Dinothrombium tinctorium]